MLHILICLIRGNTIGKNVFSLPLIRRMCSNIEGSIFRASLNGAHFLFILGGDKMNEKVKQFLDWKKTLEAEKQAELEKKRAEEFKKEKEQLLLKLGLFEKVYSEQPMDGISEEFPYYEYDKETNKYRYYKKVVVEVTDEEYAEICKYAQEEEQEKSHSNMFKGEEIKNIPDKLENVLVADKVSYNLWIWAKRLETLGKVLMTLLIIAGVILAFTSSYVEKEVPVEDESSYSYYYDDYEEETEIKKVFDAEMFFTVIADTALYAFIVYCSYHVLALLIGALASIVQNTKITADIALLEAKKDISE